jgi:transcriptional regulator with XRE-family HTH domain
MSAVIELAEAVQALDPKDAARQIVEAHAGEAGWLDAFAEQLDRRRAGGALERVLAAWGLSQSDAARLFGVSRQAVSKWLDAGVPSDRTEAIADLAAATDLLTRHIKRDRIPAVVRRRAAALDNASLIDLLATGDTARVLTACRDMFRFGEAHA